MEFITDILQICCKGKKEKGTPNQDFFLITETSNLLIVTVSDGLGSATNSLIGAIAACKIVTDILLYENEDISSKIVHKWNSEIKLNKGKISDFRTANSFLVVYKELKEIVIGQLGDVFIALNIDGNFHFFNTNEKDFLNETECLGSENNEMYKLRTYSFENYFEFLIATDGVADDLRLEKLDMLFIYLKSKYDGMSYKQRKRELKKEIIANLNTINNDDKTLIFGWLKNMTI